jgi:hypothetical protein
VRTQLFTTDPQAVKILRSNVEIIFFLQQKVSSAYVTAELRCPVRGAQLHAATLKVEHHRTPIPHPCKLQARTEDLCIAIACSVQTHSITHLYR